MSEHGQVAITFDPDICPGCGEQIVGSVVTDSFLYIDSRRATPLIVASDAYIHIHNVVLADQGELTVRAAVTRWWRHRLFNTKRWWRQVTDRTAD